MNILPVNEAEVAVVVDDDDEKKVADETTIPGSVSLTRNNVIQIDKSNPSSII